MAKSKVKNQEMGKKILRTLNKNPEDNDEENTKKLFRSLWGIKLPPKGQFKQFRSKEETFTMLKEGKLKLKCKPNRLTLPEYESETTEDAVKREKSKYIKGFEKKGHIQKRKIKHQYIFIKGQDERGRMQLWKIRLKRKPEMEHGTASAYYETELEHDQDKTNVSSKLSDIDIEAICKIIKPLRTPIVERLKKFEEERNERKRETPMLEDEKQKYVRKYKAGEAKKIYLEIFQKFLNEKVNAKKNQIIKTEAKKYSSQMDGFKRVAQGAFEALLEELKVYSEYIKNNEINDAIKMRQEFLKEEIMIAATQKETELQYSYKNLFLPASLSQQNEFFQLVMSSYTQNWAKKVNKIEKEVEVQRHYLQRQSETTKILQAAEHIPLIKKSFAEKVKAAEEESKLLIIEVLESLRQKTEILENLRQENIKLLDSTKHYANALPEFVYKLKEFIKLSLIESFEKEQLLKVLDNIETLRQKLLKQNQELLKPTDSDSSSLKGLSSTKSDTATLEKLEEMFNTTPRTLSASDFEEPAKRLIKVKLAGIDLQKRAVQTSKESNSKIEEAREESNKSFQKEDELSSIEKTEFFAIPENEKLKEINEKLDILRVVGDEYSVPNLVKVGDYINKRIADVDNIISKHDKMI